MTAISPVPKGTPASSAGKTQTLKSLVPSAWKKTLAPEMAKASFKQLETFLADEAKAGKNVFPPKAQIFAALERTPPGNVKVVVLGQDPYPTQGVANGLSFSVAAGVKIPASLKNIFEGVRIDTHAPPPKSGDLTPWADQGVLLLNTVLTVREGEANSHHGKGWESFTEAVLKKVNEQPGPVVFLCLGKQAAQMAARIVDPKKNFIVAQPHPSPLAGTAFVDAVKRDHPFQKINALLTKGGRAPIDWSLAPPAVQGGWGNP
jgi:uracil-DNA glycosylase